MAQKKAGGSSRNGRDSPGQRLGVKKFGGELVTPGTILVRQRGTKFYPSVNTSMGKDHSIFSKVKGFIVFTKGYRNRVFVSVHLDSFSNREQNEEKQAQQ